MTTDNRDGSGRRPDSAGFTLIEVMIVIVIVAILAAVAYPSYTRYVQNARMATAQGDLVELAQWMERQYSLSNTYAGAALPFNTSPREAGSTTAYTIALSGVAANTFTLTATPVGPQQGHECGNLTLDQTGSRGAAETNCWR